MADNLFDIGEIKILSPTEAAALLSEPNSPAPKSTTEPNEGTDPPTPTPNPDGFQILGPQPFDPDKKPVATDNDTPSDLPESKDSQTKSDAPKINVDFQALAEVLAEKGLFELPEDGKIESDEDILDLMRGKIDNKAQGVFESWRKNLPPKEQAFLGFREAGYTTDDAMELSSYKELATSISDTSSEEDLEEVYRLYLESKELDESEINDSIETAKDLNKLKEKGLQAKDRLLKIIEDDTKQKEIATAAAIEAHKKNTAAKFTNLMSRIDNTAEIIPGISITPKMKEKIKESMTKAVEVQGDRQLNAVSSVQAKNPEGFNILLHYYTQMGLFNLDKDGNFKPDVSKLSTKVTSQATKNLVDTVTKGNDPNPRGTDNDKPNSLLSKLDKYSNKFQF